jgi:hypothetical protein
MRYVKIEEQGLRRSWKSLKGRLKGSRIRRKRFHVSLALILYFSGFGRQHPMIASTETSHRRSKICVLYIISWEALLYRYEVLGMHLMRWSKNRNTAFADGYPLKSNNQTTENEIHLYINYVH